MKPTKAWLRVKKQIDEYSRSTGVKIDRAPAMRAERLSENPIQGQQLAVLENPTPRDGEKNMATAKQKAAARRNIKKAQAARRRKAGGGRRRKSARRRPVRARRRRMRANPVAKTMAGRRRQRAASRRNIKKAQKARRRSRRVTSRVRSIRKAAGRGGIRLVRVRRASTPIVIEEKGKRRSRRRKKALLANPKRRKRSRRRRHQTNNLTFRDKRAALLENPRGGGFNGLSYDNPTFTISAIQAAGMAGFGVGLGLVIADFLDRFVATRKPSGGTQPWYGANAAAAVNRRPDAWRLGAQAAGGVGAIGLAYLARGRSFLPFLFGGTAVGFFANLTKELINWWAMPMILKTKLPTEATLANRMYPLEQKDIQDSVAAIFEKYMDNAVLAANQPATGDPIVPSVAPGSGRSMLGQRQQYAGHMVGKARTQAEAGNGQVGRPVLVPTGRLGMCDTCGGDNGCWSDCEDLTLCGDCGDNLVARRCEYVVQPGDPDAIELARGLNIDMAQINALNPPGDPSVYWVAGKHVVLPYAMCVALQSGPVANATNRPNLCLPGFMWDPNLGRCVRAPVASFPNRPELTVPSNGFVTPGSVVYGTPGQIDETVPPPVAQSSVSVPFGLADLPDDL